MKQLQSRPQAQELKKLEKTPAAENTDLSEQHEPEADDGDIEKQLDSDSKSNN